ncbi:hypothetical protein SALBM135S_08133 [Streptomyces alboniger]
MYRNRASQKPRWGCCHASGSDFYDCLSGREVALFELVDALLCTDGPVRVLVDLRLRRGPASAPPGSLARATCVAKGGTRTVGKVSHSNQEAASPSAG